MISTKQFSVALAGAFLFSAVTWLSTVAIQLGAPTESSRWIAEIIAAKFKAANKLRGPKLIFLGGSSTLFGVQARRAEAAIGIQSLNMGTHAGLGISYILNLGRQVAHRGDKVVIALEYQLYFSDGRPNDVLIDYAFSREPELIWKTPLGDQAGWWFGISAKRVVRGLLSRVRPDRKLLTGYQADTLNDRGDETNNDSIHRDALRVSGLRPLSVLLGKGDPSYAWKEIDIFSAWCKDNGVTLIATYPVTVRFSEYSTPVSNSLLSGIDMEYRRRGIPTLGKPQDFLWGRDCFFDTIYHLTNDCSAKRTDMLVSLLEREL